MFALLAVGETMVVLTRNVDLSVGSVLGLSAFLSADLFGKHPGIPIVLVFLVGMAIGDRLRHRQRAPDHDRPGAEPGRDARDALHHPRHRHPRRRQRPGRRELAAELVPEHPAGDDPRDSRSRDRDRGGRRRRRLLPALVPLGPRAVRDRLEPRRCAPRRHPDRDAGLHGVRDQRRPRRDRRRALGGALRHDRLDRRAPATSSRSSRPSWSAAWRSSAAAAPSSERRSARCC